MSVGRKCEFEAVYSTCKNAAICSFNLLSPPLNEGRIALHMLVGQSFAMFSLTPLQ